MELSKYVHNNKELPGTVVTLYIYLHKRVGETRYIRTVVVPGN